jgi:hypothetical protein
MLRACYVVARSALKYFEESAGEQVCVCCSENYVVWNIIGTVVKQTRTVPGTQAKVEGGEVVIQRRVEDPECVDVGRVWSRILEQPLFPVFAQPAECDVTELRSAVTASQP